MNSKKSRIAILFILIVLGLALFLFAMAYRAVAPRPHGVNTNSSHTNTALRGSIITSDGYSVAHSQKLYKTMLDTRNLDPNKKDLFVKLYTLYTGDDPKRIVNVLNSKKGVVTLSYTVSAKDAAHLMQLSRKLNRLKVFVSRKDEDDGDYSGLNVQESGQNRIFVAGNALTPVIGYTGKIEDGKITKVIGKKGIERVYDDVLRPAQDSKIKGPRDIGNSIILTSESNLANRVDGYNVVLATSLKFQTMLERIVDKKREFLDATEIIVCVMDSKTGKILSLVSSSRYDPGNIFAKDIRVLNSTANEYAYEVGSVFKPFIFAILLNENKVRVTDNINTYNGRYQLTEKRTITDTHPEPSMIAEDIITYSSNIGMIELSKRLSGLQIYYGLMKFGFSQKSDIDLPYEQTGKIPPVEKLESKIYKATVSYGYGVSATFMQLMKAYNVFNNKGVAVTPRLVSHLERNGHVVELPTNAPKEVVSQEIAKTMKRILVKVVEKGTGQKGRTPGLEVGGKTGTAHIASRGRGYENVYNGSFFGFANDSQGHGYTIGVLAREPKRPYHYFGAQSALPVFKEAVDLLVAEGYLIPNEIAADPADKKPADKKQAKKQEKIVRD